MYLWYLLNSLAMQVNLDFEVVIVDDGDLKCLKQEVCVRGIKTLEDKGVRVRVHDNVVSLGLSKSRNVASDMAENDIVVKLDDDHYCDALFTQAIIDAYKQEPEAGCVGTLFPFIRDGIVVVEKVPEKFGVLDDPGWENQQLKLYSLDLPLLHPAVSVRGIMAYRKDPNIRHNEKLSKVSHREDTLFSMAYVNAGYSNYVCIRAIAYHLYAVSGGCRSFSTDDTNKQRIEDEKLFKKVMEK